MRTGSALVLVTTTVKVKAPPGAGRLVGLAALVTATVGGTLVRVTVAWALAWVGTPWMSTAVAVTVSVCDAPASPVKGAVNWQLYVPPGASTVPMALVQVELARVVRSP